MTDSVNVDYLAAFLRITANKPVTMQFCPSDDNVVSVSLTVEKPAQGSAINAVLLCSLSSDGKTVTVSTESQRANEVSITDISLETPASLVGPNWVETENDYYSGIFCGGSMGDVVVFPFIEKRNASDPGQDTISICTKSVESAEPALTTFNRDYESTNAIAGYMYDKVMDVYAVKIGDYDDYADDAARISAILAYFG